MRTICLLGASGSIGSQTIEIMLKNREDFDLLSFSVGYKTRCVSYILRKFPNVKTVYVREKSKKNYYAKKYPQVNFYSEKDIEIADFLRIVDVDMVVNALVGNVGLKPTISALEWNKILCLANKESLVMGGELVNKLLDEGKGKLYPIDSEHVGLAKCLNVDRENMKKCFITASGGALRDFTIEQIQHATIQDVLNHPNWNMGNKITVDSATMMNKVFEIIEAYHLFGIKGKKFGVMINRDSNIHAGVEYEDGYRLDISKPDMRVPIKWSLYESKVVYKTTFVGDLSKAGHPLEPISYEKYPLLRYADYALTKGGTYGAALNAVNEACVYAFLDATISYVQIYEVVDKLMKNYKIIPNPSLEDILEENRKMLIEAKELCKKIGGKK